MSGASVWLHKYRRSFCIRPVYMKSFCFPNKISLLIIKTYSFQGYAICNSLAFMMNVSVNRTCCIYNHKIGLLMDPH
jgi:hypothetical protein